MRKFKMESWQCARKVLLIFLPGWAEISGTFLFGWETDIYYLHVKTRMIYIHILSIIGLDEEALGEKDQALTARRAGDIMTSTAKNR